MEQNKSTPCHKDVFHCARCGLTMMMKEPLERERCPSCRTRAWDLGEMDCYECGHRWTPRSDTPQFCPECRTRLKTV